MPWAKTFKLKLPPLIMYIISEMKRKLPAGGLKYEKKKTKGLDIKRYILIQTKEVGLVVVREGGRDSERTVYSRGLPRRCEPGSPSAKVTLTLTPPERAPWFAPWFAL